MAAMLDGLLRRITGQAELDEAAAKLARAFTAAVPNTSRRASATFNRAVEAMLGEAKGMARARKWGFVSANRLANKVRWRLVEAGFATDLAEDVARQLALAVTHAGEKRRPKT